MLGMPEAEDVPGQGSAGARLLSSLGAAGPAWTVRPGIRLAAPRRLLLRLLAPFVDRQHDLDAQVVSALYLLADRVSELETALAATEGPRDPLASESGSPL